MSDVSPRKTKKLPFKPTALRRPATPVVAKPTQEPENGGDSAAKGGDAQGADGDEDDSLALFRRSREMAHIVAADSEKRWKRKQKQRELEEEAERLREARSGKRPATTVDVDEEEEDKGVATGSSPQRHLEPRPQSRDAEHEDRSANADRASELVTPPPSKRSRLSSSSSKKPSISIEEAVAVSATEASPSAHRSRSHVVRDSVPTRSPLGNRQEAGLSSAAAKIIALDDDSDDQEVAATPSRTNRTQRSTISSSPEVVPVETDAELPAAAKSPTAPPATELPEEEEFAEYIRRAEEKRARDKAAAAANSKAVALILVSSPVPGAQSLLIKATFDLQFLSVRKTWVTHQLKRGGVAISPADADDIILTWRRRRIYLSSSLSTLGIRPALDGSGCLTVDGHRREGLNEDRSRVLLEAWTPELFHEMERQAALRDEGGDDDGAGAAAAAEEETPIVHLRVMLKARDYEPVKLTVRPETTVDTLITGFRAQRTVPSDKEVSMWFDGERLEEHTTMEDAEIDDKDAIEVHIK